MAKTNRRISKDGSIRIGSTVFKKGDEKALYEQISPERAARLVEMKHLSGDWSGAKGKAEKELEKTRRQRARSTPMGRMIRSALEEDDSDDQVRGRGTSDEDELEDGTGDEPDLGNAALPIQSAGGEGGWYSFQDANGDELLTLSGETYKVRGADDAEAFVNATNGE